MTILAATHRDLSLVGAIILSLALMQVFTLASKLYKSFKRSLQAEVHRAVQAKIRKAIADERARTNDNYFGSWR